MNQTLHYYDKNAQDFINGTVSVDFTEIQNEFIRLLPSDAYILDFGCGSGRDTKYFLSQRLAVDAIDGSETICRIASEYTGIKVRQIMFQELDEIEKYDGIWACASILHLRKQELPDVLHKMRRAVKQNGIIYMSFKYGEFEGYLGERYFTNLTERSMQELLQTVPELRVEKQWVNGDVREGRGDERWLNVVMRKDACIDAE